VFNGKIPEISYMSLRHIFPDGFKSLKRLFGEPSILQKEDRLNEIHQICESAWERNVDRLRNTTIKYLLIGEAPPWTDGGTGVSYFYENLKGSWVNRILKVFFDPIPISCDTCLNGLAENHFLLVDSLPFAMKYTTNKRMTQEYSKLIDCCSEYLTKKVNDPRLTWDNDPKAALAFHWNGLKLIEAFPNGIKLRNGKIITLTENNIAVDKSNYTSTSLLKEIWQISDLSTTLQGAKMGQPIVAHDVSQEYWYINTFNCHCGGTYDIHSQKLIDGHGTPIDQITAICKDCNSQKVFSFDISNFHGANRTIKQAELIEKMKNANLGDLYEIASKLTESPVKTAVDTIKKLYDQGDILAILWIGDAVDFFIDESK